MSISIAAIDHLVLTVADIERTCEFYRQVLGMRVIRFRAANAGGADRDSAARRTALRFGTQKINLHQQGREFVPRARHPRPGSADLCLIADTPLELVLAHLQSLSVPVEIGPVSRSGARGGLRSVYIRDPDENLIEISNYLPAATDHA